MLPVAQMDGLGICTGSAKGQFKIHIAYDSCPGPVLHAAFGDGLQPVPHARASILSWSRVGTACSKHPEPATHTTCSALGWVQCVLHMACRAKASMHGYSMWDQSRAHAAYSIHTRMALDLVHRASLWAQSGLLLT